MALSIPFLAQDENPTMKIIIGLAFFAFWIVTQIIAALGKNKDKTPSPESQPLPQAPSSGPPPMRVPRQADLPMSQQSQRRGPVAQAPAPARQRPPKIKRKGPALPPPLQAPVTVRSPVANVSREVEFDPHAPVVAKPSGAERLRATLRPGNLREQFILTEVLRKPIALRDSNDTPGG